jgi:myo-inositol-1(or 4)-monophosphatase
VSDAAPGAGGPGRAERAALADLAVRTAREAGALVLAGLDHARSVAATKSSLTDVVTEVDRASERLIVGRLLEARPHDAILGEEGGGSAGSSGVRWLVDPIDGTVNYLYGHPGFAISIAAELGGELVAGTVFDPWRDELFCASQGAGATRNGLAIHCNTVETPALALVATGFSYRAERRARQARVLAELLPAIRDVRRVGSAALDLCGVAIGRVDGYYETDLNPWDLAAGTLIAREAGALVTDLTGEGPPSTTQGVLAANPRLHGALAALLGDAELRVSSA